MNICKKCFKKKESSEYYSSNRNECKDCVKKRVRKREEELKKDPLFIEKERARHREKYHRLNYKEAQKKWDKNRPWKNTSTYKNLHRDMSKKYDLEGKSLHHWCYLDKYLKDVIIMNKADHKRLHTYLTFDDDTLSFRTLNGTLLDTKEKHLNYWESVKNLD